MNFIKKYLMRCLISFFMLFTITTLFAPEEERVESRKVDRDKADRDKADRDKAAELSKKGNIASNQSEDDTSQVPEQVGQNENDRPQVPEQGSQKGVVRDP